MRKILIVILAILFLISASASVIGFIEHNKSPENKPDPKPKELITYEYYLEEQQQETMPTNSEEASYVFSKYICTNNVSGTFDNDTWKFTPNEEKESVCKLYFVKSEYEISLTATNAVIENNTDGLFKVAREGEGSFEITPNEGYVFKNVLCSNDKEALYDLSTNTLTIHSVMEDVACQVNFEIKVLKADITVKNGDGTTTETANYGESISAIVVAKDGYEKPKITCTNDQQYTYENNNFKIEKLTDNTACTITFNKTPVTTYKLIIKDLPDTVVITSGTTEQSIVAGKDAAISFKPNEGYTMTLSCTVTPSDIKEEEGGIITYTFLAMNKDNTCTVKATQVEVDIGN